MQASLAPRKSAKLFFATVFAAGIMLVPFGGGLSGPTGTRHATAPLITLMRDTANSFVRGSELSATPAELEKERAAFEKEQAMSPHELIDRWTPFIKEAARRFNVSENWIKAVMRMESGGRTLLDENRPITSSSGAMGIMQVMPGTYDEMRRQYQLGADPYNPRDNVLAGAAYLRWLYGKYGYPKMFAAYNAGPGTLDAHLAGERSLPDETRAYVSGIVRILGGKPAALESKTIALTRPDGSSITVDSAAVDFVRAPLEGEYAPGVQAVVNIGHLHQGVKEDLETVSSLIRAHGGRAKV